MQSNEPEDTVIIWEAPKIVPPELRVYYDADGKIICYTCGVQEGNYIVITPLQYAEGRPELRVINGKLTNMATCVVISKLVPDTIEGQRCLSEDISIIASPTDQDAIIKWKLKTHEFT